MALSLRRRVTGHSEWLHRPHAIERQRATPGGTADPRFSFDFALRGLVEATQSVLTAIQIPSAGGGLHRQIDHQGQRLGRAVAGVDMLEADPGAQQESGATEDEHRRGDFGDDEHAAECSTLSRGASICRHDLHERDASRVPRRAEAEEDADEERRRRAEHRHANIEHQGDGAGQQPWRQQRRCDVEDRRADGNAEQPAEGRQHEAFRQQLHRNSPPASAEGRPNGQLTRACRGSRHEQVGHVGTTHQQHEADDAEEQNGRQPQLRPHERRPQSLEQDAVFACAVRN